MSSDHYDTDEKVTITLLDKNNKELSDQDNMIIKKSRASAIKVPSGSRKCSECKNPKPIIKDEILSHNHNLINIEAIDRLFPNQRP